MGKKSGTKCGKNLDNALHEGLVHLSFTKVDGTIRDMICTLNPMQIPTGGVIASNDKPKPDHVKVIYDTEHEGWRSFRKDSLLNWSVWE